MSSPSTAVKVNYLVMRYLHFQNARGDLQEGHVYAKRLRDYASRCHLSLCSSTKMPILCSKGSKTGGRRQKAHKNLDFVLEKAENVGFEGQKRTKTSILCSKCPKTGVPEAKSAQKCQFCARNARKCGFRRQKAHKMPFVCSGGSFGMGLIPVPIVPLRRVARNLLRLWRMRWLGRI